MDASSCASARCTGLNNTIANNAKRNRFIAAPVGEKKGPDLAIEPLSDALRELLLLRGCGDHRLRRRVRVAAQRIGDVRNRLLRFDAVAGVIERRRDYRDTELARRHGDDSTADAALGREAGVIEPLAG